MDDEKYNLENGKPSGPRSLKHIIPASFIKEEYCNKIAYTANDTVNNVRNNLLLRGFLENKDFSDFAKDFMKSE